MYWLKLLVIGILFNCTLTTSQLTSNYHTGYRTVNWCVTGKDEPELHEWPFSQFVPLLRRTNRLREDRIKTRYDLRFYDIATIQSEVGDDGHLYKTLHVAFKVYKRDPKKAIREAWEPLPLEGLIIQANANPYTLAVPTGQFFPPGDYIDPSNAEVHCKDCPQHLWARSIMCRKRAKIHMEHPTVLAWHHMQRSSNTSSGNEEGSQSLSGDAHEAGELPPAPIPFLANGRQSEVHANFRFYSPKCAATRRMMFTLVDHKSVFEIKVF